jgi:hypothetical protein
MSVRHLVMFSAPMAIVAGALSASLAAGPQTGKPAGQDMPMHGMSSMSTMTKAQKIANAMTAAPSSVSANATILDWPAKEGLKPDVLRAGTNGWTCLPDMAESKGNDPMCVDATWMKWFDAYLAHKTPEITTVGVAYMLAPGGGWASNSDPFATTQTSDNHWAHHPPHMMIVVPDQKSLAALPTDPQTGGPYVMWAGTPYAHIMAPVAMK